MMNNRDATPTRQSGLHLVLLATLLLFVHAVKASTIGRNLVANGDAESDLAVWQSIERTLTLCPSSWAESAPPSSNFGTQMFCGQSTSGIVSTTRATQTISLTLNSTESQWLEAGELVLELSAMLGGYFTQDDTGSVTAEMVDAFGAVLAMTRVGPVTPRDRYELATLVFRRTFWRVPPRTATIRVTLVCVKGTASGSSNDGYIDNVSVVLEYDTAFASREVNVSLPSGNVVLNGDATTEDASTWTSLSAYRMTPRLYTWLGAINDSLLPPAAERGVRFFSGGDSASIQSATIASQFFRLSPLLRNQATSELGLEVVVSAWMGGFEGHDDLPSVKCVCYDARGTEYSFLETAPVTPTARGGATKFLFVSQRQLLPQACEIVAVMIIMDKRLASGVSNDAYLDLLSMSFAVPTPHVVALGENMLLNGGGESGLAGWIVTTPLNQPSLRPYPPSGMLDWPTAGLPPVSERGTFAFVGAMQDGPSTFVQMYAVSNSPSIAAAIAGGNASVVFSAWLGGYKHEQDYSVARCDILDENGTVLSTVTLGPLWMHMREARTRFMFFQRSAAVHPQCRRLRVTVSLVRFWGLGDTDAVADLIDLRVILGARPPDAPPPVAEPPANRTLRTWSDRSFDRTMPVAPWSITEVSSTTTASLRGIALMPPSERFIAMADDWLGGFRVADISDPLAPAFVFQDFPGGWLHCVAAHPDGVHIFAGSGSGLFVYAFNQSKSTGSRVGSLDLPSTYRLRFSTDYRRLYSGKSDGFAVFSLDDPKSPILEVEVSTGSAFVSDVAFAGLNDRWLIVGRSTGLSVFDNSAPDQPAWFADDSASDGFDVRALKYVPRRQLLIVGYEDGDVGVFTFNESSGVLRPLRFRSAGSIVHDLDVSPDEQRVIVGVNMGTTMIDIASASEALVVGRASLQWGGAEVLWSRANPALAFVADYSGGFKVQMFRSLRPLLSSRYQLLTRQQCEDYALEVELNSAATVAYVSVWQRGVQSVNVSNPLAMNIVGATRVSSTGNTRDQVLARSRNLLFVSQNDIRSGDDSAGLMTVAINPTNPMSLSRVGYAAFGTSTGVSVSHDEMTLFLCTRTSGLQFINITNPSSPTLFFSIPGDFHKVHISRRWPFLLYASECSRGVLFIDITDVRFPVIVLETKPPGVGCIYNLRASPLENFLVADANRVWIANITDLTRVVWAPDPLPSVRGVYEVVWTPDQTAVLASDMEEGVKVISIFADAEGQRVAPELRGWLDTPGQTRSVIVRPEGTTAFATDGMHGLWSLSIGSNLLAVATIRTPDILDLRGVIRVALEHRASVTFFTRSGVQVTPTVSQWKLVDDKGTRGSVPYWFTFNPETLAVFCVPSRDWSDKSLTVAFLVSHGAIVNEEVWVTFTVLPSLILKTVTTATDGGTPEHLEIATPASLVAIRIKLSHRECGRFVVQPFGAVAASFDRSSGELNALGTLVDVNRMLRQLLRLSVDDPALARVATATITVDDTVNRPQTIAQPVLSIFRLNQPVELRGTLANFTGKRGVPFEFAINVSAFHDPDDALTFTTVGLLPSWLQFVSSLNRMQGLTTEEVQVVVMIAATDGYTSTNASFTLTITNVAPQASATPLLPPQNIKPGVPFQFQLRNPFTDADDEKLSYEAHLPNGAPLPSWISFDKLTLTFAGVALELVALEVAVTASDGYLSATGSFIVNATNLAPVPTASPLIPIQAVKLGVPFVIRLDEPFRDGDDAALTFEAQQSNGAPLPSWLSFDRATLRFTGTALQDASVDVRVTASDGFSTAHGSFAVIAFDVAPHVANPVPNATFKLGRAFFVDVSKTFDDLDDTPAILRYTLSREGDADLPQWIKLDRGQIAVTGTSMLDSSAGALDTNYTMEYVLRLTASDGFKENSTVFTISFVDAVPQYVNGLSPIRFAAKPLTAATFEIPRSLFVDPDDDSNTLRYSCTLLDGVSPIYSWISFSEMPLALTVDPPRQQDGHSTSILLSVTDGNLRASATVNLTVLRNRPPTAKVRALHATWLMDAEGSLAAMEDTFADPDNDTLTFFAETHDGNSLPPWLKFSAARGQVSGKGAEEELGTHDFRLVARDHMGLQAEIVATIEVRRSDLQWTLYVIEMISAIVGPLATVWGCYAYRTYIWNFFLHRYYFVPVVPPELSSGEPFHPRKRRNNQPLAPTDIASVMVLRHIKKKEESRFACCIAKLTHGMQTAVYYRPTVDGGGFPGWITWNETTCEMMLMLSELPRAGVFRIQLRNFDDFIVFETPLFVSKGQICSSEAHVLEEIENDENTELPQMPSSPAYTGALDESLLSTDVGVSAQAPGAPTSPRLKSSIDHSLI